MCHVPITPEPWLIFIYCCKCPLENFPPSEWESVSRQPIANRYHPSNYCKFRGCLTKYLINCRRHNKPSLSGQGCIYSTAFYMWYLRRLVAQMKAYFFPLISWWVRNVDVVILPFRCRCIPLPTCLTSPRLHSFKQKATYFTQEARWWSIKADSVTDVLLYTYTLSNVTGRKH